MRVNMNNLARGHSELLTFKLIGDTYLDEYGIETSSFPEIKAKCIVSEEITNTLDVSTGSYLKRITYQIYVPYKIAKENDIIGAFLTRSNGQELIVSQTAIMRSYASHAMFIATERKVWYDRR